MQIMIDFFSTPIFSVISGISILMMFFSFFLVIYLVLKANIKVWWRLGNALSKRKIAIFADDQFKELKDILVDSNMFLEKNIIEISYNSLEKAEDCTLFLVHYAKYKDQIQKIIELKKPKTALIIYAPPNIPRITKPTMSELNLKENTIVVNFRGRLLNDIFSSMITTGFK